MSTRGLSKAGLEHLHEVMAGHVDAGRVPGLVLALSRADEVHTDAIGTAAIGGSEPIRPDAIFRITSMTRPVTAAQSQTSVERTNSAPATMSGPPARRARTGHSVRTAQSIRRGRKTRRVGDLECFSGSRCRSTYGGL